MAEIPTVAVVVLGALRILSSPLLYEILVDGSSSKTAGKALCPDGTAPPELIARVEAGVAVYRERRSRAEDCKENVLFIVSGAAVCDRSFLTRLQKPI